MFKTGDSYSKDFVATEQTIKGIADISGDRNPLHLDEEYAAKGIFGKRIAHGLFCLNGISMILGCYFPGPGTVILEQKCKYLAPVYIGDKVNICVTVQKVEGKKIELCCICKNQDGKIVLESEMLVMRDESQNEKG